MSKLFDWRLAGVMGIALSIAQACVCADGTFTYNVKLTAQDQDGLPIEGAKVAVLVFVYDYYGLDAGEIDDVDDYEYNLTDAEGVSISEHGAGLAWGGCPPPDKAPIPDNPKEVVVVLEYPPNVVLVREFAIDDTYVTDRRSGELDIDLGVIVVETEQP